MNTDNVLYSIEQEFVPGRWGVKEMVSSQQDAERGVEGYKSFGITLRWRRWVAVEPVCTCGFGRVGDFHWPGCPLKDVPSLNFATVADKDRHYICEIGRLFWGSDKQCYAADAVFEKVRQALMPRGRPPNTIICLVGSTKFTREMMIRSWELSKQNCIVLGWNVLPHDMCVDSHGAEAEGVKEQIDELHKRKIDMCDEVHVINISGYIGESTRSEIEYALDLRKRVKFLFAAPIMCRKEIGPAIHPRLGLGSPLCGRMQGHNGRCNPVIPVGMEYAPTPDASEPCKQPIGNTTCGYPESACMHTGSKDTIIPLNGRHDYKP